MITMLCSAAGSPGVTTTALGMALYSPGPTLLVDVDRDPSQAVLAGWLGGSEPRGRGIVPAMHERVDHAGLRRFCLPLTDEGDRAFLPGFPQPANVNLAAGAWPTLAHILREASDAGEHVIVDAGRVTASGLPTPLLAVVDVVALVVRSSLRSLVAARLAVGGLGEDCERGLLMIGPGHPYSTTEAGEALELPVLGTIPDLPEHASVLSDGAPAPRRFSRSPLCEAYRTLNLRPRRAVA